MASPANANSRPKPLRAKALLEKSFQRIPEYKRQPGQPAAVLYELLLRSPDEMLDMITVTCQACHAAGLPPGVPSAKELMNACYTVYCEERAASASQNPPAPAVELSAEEKRQKYDTWVDSNEAMEKTVELVFSKAREHFQR